MGQLPLRALRRADGAASAARPATPTTRPGRRAARAPARASAVAASFAAVAIGTETDGSVVCPATANGVVGIKPTVGLVSRRGVVPISHSQDTAGPMARTVADAVVVLEAMIGRDDRDPATAVATQAANWHLAEHLRSDGLQGKRIGVVRSDGRLPQRGGRAARAGDRRSRSRGRDGRRRPRVRRGPEGLGPGCVRRPALRVQARPERLPGRASRRANGCRPPPSRS